MSEREILAHQQYLKWVNVYSPKTSIMHSLFSAFLVGGLTSVINQGFVDFYKAIIPTLLEEDYYLFALCTIVTIAIVLTGIGVYDKFATFGGAGTFLPITGFANAMSSASLEFKTEGLVFGTSVKMFTVVGPVIVNGVFWSTVAGIVYYLLQVCGVFL